MAVVGVRTCVVCNTAMVAVEPGQITHPCCDPDDTRLPALSIEEIAELIGDLGQCPVCGDPIRGPGLTKRCRPNHKLNDLEQRQERNQA
jgi:hypothetical protein